MDHSRVNISALSISCGVLGLDRISDDIPGVLYQIASRLYHPARGDPVAIIVWSDAESEGKTNGEQLSDLIGLRDLGWVSTSASAENPKTGNNIYMVSWIIDHTKFKAWYAAERIRRIKKVGT